MNPMPAPEPAPGLDLDALLEELKDADLRYLCDRRIQFIKDSVLIELLLAMRAQLKEGVEVFYKGAKQTANRKLKPDELLKLNKAINDISPEIHAAAASRDPDRDAAANVAGSNMDLDVLARATQEPPPLGSA